MRKKRWLILFVCLIFTACSANIPAATEVPTEVPTELPTEVPTELPTEEPTEIPTEEPTDVPAEEPTIVVEAVVGELARDYISALSEEIGSRTAGSPQELEASQYIVSVFESFGYLPEVQEFTFTSSNGNSEVTSSNVIAVKEGLSEEIIIIGAHYDTVSVGMGADDNASGVAVMLETAKMLQEVDTPYTIYFIAFGAEEVGLQGSNYYVDQMTDEEKANTIVMVNLDSLIAGDIAYVYGGDGEGGTIRDWLLNWAEEEELPLQTQNGENPTYPAGTTGDWSDHAPFKEAGIPYVYYESTNWTLGDKDGYTQVDQTYGSSGQIWHTEYDTLGYIEKSFPGRIDERLALFVSDLFKIGVEYSYLDD